MPVKDPFYLCYFETTRDCNLNCEYCMSRPDQPPKDAPLSTAEAKTLVLDQLAKVSPNVAVAFSGGEHLMRPDAFELLEHAAGLGFWSFINTNGRVLVETDAVERAMKATGNKVIFVLPINSTDVELNKKSRDDEPSTVLKAVEKCREKGAEHFFLLTISKQNLATLDSTIRFLKMNRVPMLRAPFVPRGAGNHHLDLAFDEKDMKEKIHPVLSANPQAYISFTPFFADPGRIRQIWDHFKIRIDGLGCQAGRSFAAVGAEGNITPCVQLLDSGAVCGNVRSSKLSEVIKSHPTFTALRERKNLKGRCGRCRYKDTCGGCRALAYYKTGDILAEDHTCFFHPETTQDRCELETMQTDQMEKFLEFIKYSHPWNSLF